MYACECKRKGEKERERERKKDREYLQKGIKDMFHLILF